MTIVSMELNRPKIDLCGERLYSCCAICEMSNKWAMLYHPSSDWGTHTFELEKLHTVKSVLENYQRKVSGRKNTPELGRGLHLQCSPFPPPSRNFVFLVTQGNHVKGSSTTLKWMKVLVYLKDNELDHAIFTTTLGAVDSHFKGPYNSAGRMNFGLVPVSLTLRSQWEDTEILRRMKLLGCLHHN